MTTTRDTLVSARALIERGWTQRATARDAMGSPVASKVGVACSWCTVGAVIAVSVIAVSGADNKPYDDAIVALKSATDSESLIAWNDDPDRTQSDVLAAFDRAIAAQEAP